MTLRTCRVVTLSHGYIILLSDFSLLYCYMVESLDTTDTGLVEGDKEETSVKCTFTLGKVSFGYVIKVCTSRGEAQHATSHWSC